MCQVTSETFKISDLSKTGLLDMPPDCAYRREEIAKNINWKGFVFEPKTMNSVLSGFSFNVFADNHFLTSSRQPVKVVFSINPF